LGSLFPFDIFIVSYFVEFVKGFFKVPLKFFKESHGIEPQNPFSDCVAYLSPLDNYYYTLF
jgi:hypothetical protein